MPESVVPVGFRVVVSPTKADSTCYTFHVRMIGIDSAINNSDPEGPLKHVPPWVPRPGEFGRRRQALAPSHPDPRHTGRTDAQWLPTPADHTMSVGWGRSAKCPRIYTL